ncbi:dihydroorotate dehydrogenase electron transfer subunit [Filobacillus milosensis]|uniref:Dihydroorotate dehydrogenase B (NAD(+)), electron transfer subunit n=1 Tax=Filobacillus milosensis TaxID=94137 RepID=A0A4Y8ITA6_9BACI|nr:dihydroorotate dehydrogenase electron transfer subunit [Filobacillus milosensis]
MLQQDLSIVSNKVIAKDTYEMVLEGDLVQQIKRPGQFIHIKIGEGFSHMLRRPFSIADYSLETNQLVIIYKVIGEGSKWLSKQSDQSFINVLGPLGNGFEIDHLANQNVLVVGGGVGVPPLYALTKQLSQRNDVKAVLGYQSSDSVFYEEKFNKYANTTVATNDGSYGEEGFVTDVINQMQNQVDYYFACGPLIMLGAIQLQLRDTQGLLSVEERMGCGVGACFACVCEADNEKGYVKICQDGPVFHSNEVTLYESIS